MTTIACTRDAMACDSRVTDGDVMWPCQKVWVMPGALLGIAGSGRAMGQVIDWFMAGQPTARPDIGESEGSVRALLLTRDGIFWCDEGCFVETVRRSFHAIGTGAGPAIAAMMCGKGAVEAVQIACEIDHNSGGPVRVYRMSDVPKAARKARKIR